MSKEFIDMREMLEAGLHFGHRARYWNPKMARYIFGHRNQLHIIDLGKTAPLFRNALRFLQQQAADNKTVLFVGTKRTAQEPVRKAAELCKMPYVNQRWLGGLLTNFRVVRRSIDNLRKYEEIESSGQLKGMTKKEVIGFHRQFTKLKRDFAGLKDMGRVPDAMLVIDVCCESLAVSEAKKLGIPVVGVVDSNSDPDPIDYPIPGNDDSTSAISYYLDKVTTAMLEEKQRIEEESADEFMEVSAGVVK
ncbi:MAG: 30S ribosomal protein S2 [Candidatus Porifericomitaceae bacterium WSBS_2022_MAG_OTU9]